jgi:hypothetical protein
MLCEDMQKCRYCQSEDGGGGHQQQNVICQIALHQAMKEISVNYYLTDEMLLAFLRAERFHLNETKRRIELHFHEKRDLFGIDKLNKYITWEDLGDEAIHHLTSGTMQILPTRDIVGRIVVFGVPMVDFTGASILAAGKATYYFWMCLAEDTFNQQNGVVGILWRVHSAKFNPARTMAVTKIRGSLPLRMAGNHICHSGDAFIRPFLQWVVPILPRQGRVRIRQHFGAPVECLYSLYQYGINVDCVPLKTTDETATIMTNDTIVSNEHIQQWFIERQQIEAQRNRRPRISDAVMARLSGISGLGDDFMEVLEKMPEDAFDELDDLMGLDGDDDDLLLDTITTSLATRTSSIYGQSIAVAVENSISADRQSYATTNSQLNENSNDKYIDQNDTRSEDVLMGRGRKLQKHPGNIQFRKWIAEQIPEYEMANKHRKTEMAEKIVSQVYQNGGRFLKQCPTANKDETTTWEEIDDTAARLKVAYTFRTFRAGKASA